MNKHKHMGNKISTQYTHIYIYIYIPCTYLWMLKGATYRQRLESAQWRPWKFGGHESPQWLPMQLNLMSLPWVSLSCQQAAQLDEHFIPNTSAAWAIIAKATCRYTFMILRALDIRSAHTISPLRELGRGWVWGLCTRLAWCGFLYWSKVFWMRDTDAFLYFLFGRERCCPLTIPFCDSSRVSVQVSQFIYRYLLHCCLWTQ